MGNDTRVLRAVVIDGVEYVMTDDVALWLTSLGMACRKRGECFAARLLDLAADEILRGTR